MKNIITLLLFAIPAFAQIETTFSPFPNRPVTKITHYTAGVADYICAAWTVQPVSTITVSAISNANPGSMTATAHGFYYLATAVQKLGVWISGLTANWAPLNGWHVLTPTSANAIATDVDTSGFGAPTGTIVVSTDAPRASASIWAIQVWAPDAPSNVTLQTWGMTPVASLAGLGPGRTPPSQALLPCAMPAAFQ